MKEVRRVAVVREIIASNGARVRIRDDDIAPHGSPEEARIIMEQRLAARAILEAYARENTKEKEQKRA